MHGTAIDIAGLGVLLRGASGAGKSDLALRLIDGGARLVADDRVDLALESGRVTMRAPARLAGLLEVRGLGVMAVDAAVAAAPLGLIVDLVPTDQVERMPVRRTELVLGCAVPRLALAPFEASAAAKLRRAAVAARNGALFAA